MIGTGRHYEHRGQAVRRDHLMPVERVEYPIARGELWIAMPVVALVAAIAVVLS